MPPKPKPSTKTVQKQKDKVIEDKTFGLKNKKGAKNQQFIQQLKKQVEQGDRSLKDVEKAKQEREAKKEAEKRQKEQLDLLFKPVVELQKLQQGVDPKSVLCAYHKQGTCKKGDKCKFSHDLNIERKAAKRSLYQDVTQDNNQENNISQWDQAKLEEVVDQKHGQTNKGLPPSTIICKYFLDAVENSKYGWFWECPNGPKCHYRHALPPGFVLKKDKQKMEEQKDVVSLEELIETERQNLGMKQTKVTYKSFMEWKQRKRKEKADAKREELVKKEKSFKSGNMKGISGRELFEFNPDLVQEEGFDEGDVFDSRLREVEDDIGPVHEVNLDDFCELDDFGALPEQCETAARNVLIDEELFDEEVLDELDVELYNLDLGE